MDLQLMLMSVGLCLVMTVVISLIALFADGGSLFVDLFSSAAETVFSNNPRRGCVTVIVILMIAFSVVGVTVWFTMMSP